MSELWFFVGVLVGSDTNCRQMRDAVGFIKGVDATAYSPPVATSRFMPASSARRAMAAHRNALEASLTLEPKTAHKPIR